MITHRPRLHPFIALVAVCLAALALAGCQSNPPQASAGLSTEQIAALRAEGFEPGDDGMEFSTSDRLLFGSDEAMLAPQARVAVERIGRLLVRLDISSVRVDGHTDDTGTPAHNDQLSLQRAASVADALADAGFPRERLNARGLGSSMPIADNQSTEGRQQNRRVVIVIVSP
ncbi:OmpA family protein [Pseudothauera nasutitermitis]|uniref:OmpA family protein n=1 Tax=Pseudothauera nasutitermitis TaxID=2565930 RepID=A0A4S4ARC6_9RHOO|nr:OmpA family protein [Pseudothauera nasutitermitis]THF62315.1 OmpA family protein [Pseudothauera nasutitermitis]